MTIPLFTRAFDSLDSGTGKTSPSFIGRSIWGVSCTGPGPFLIMPGMPNEDIVFVDACFLDDRTIFLPLFFPVAAWRRICFRAA